MLFLTSITTNCFTLVVFFFLGAWWRADGWWQVRKPHHPHPALLISELQGGWEEALGRCKGLLTMSRIQDLYKYDACSVSLCNPFSKLLLSKPTICITLHKIASFIMFSLFISLCLLLRVLLYIILIIYVSLLATLPCLLSLSFHIGHDPKEKLTLEPKGEIFWVSASVPANDRDYFGDLPLPLWWIMLQHAFMSQQKKKKNGTSTCFYNLEMFTFSSLAWPHPK